MKTRIEEWVNGAVACMIEMAGRPDEDIADVLGRGGSTPAEVQALLAFVPMAFGRVALRELPVRFSDMAIVRERPDDVGREVHLSEEEVFTIATRVAIRALAQDGLTQDQFLAVAMRSAEVHAINQAVLGGADAKDLVVSPPIIRLA